MALKKVGFFFELSADARRSQLESLRPTVPHSREQDIVGYLSAGKNVGVIPLTQFDDLTDPPKSLGEIVLVSDGEWIWPSSVTYYVQTYHIDLPEQFVEHMSSHNWRTSEQIEVEAQLIEGHVEL